MTSSLITHKWPQRALITTNEQKTMKTTGGITTKLPDSWMLAYELRMIHRTFVIKWAIGSFKCLWVLGKMKQGTHSSEFLRENGIEIIRVQFPEQPLACTLFAVRIKQSIHENYTDYGFCNDLNVSVARDHIKNRLLLLRLPPSPPPPSPPLRSSITLKWTLQS